MTESMDVDAVGTAIDDVIDLREPGDDRPSFVALVLDPGAPARLVADALGRLPRPVATEAWPTTDAFQWWARVVEAMRRLDRPSPYVGSFQVAVREAASNAVWLDDRDRAAVALFLLDTTAARAVSGTDFEQGIAAAQHVDPFLEEAASVVPLVLAACLRVDDPGERPHRLAVGVPAAISRIRGSRRPVLHPADMWVLRAALLEMAPDGRVALRQLLPELHKQDRNVLESLLRPTTGRGRRTLRRR